MEGEPVNILFLAASLKKTDGRIDSPILDEVRSFGDVTVIETDSRRIDPNAPLMTYSQWSNKESGTRFKKPLERSVGFYMNPHDVNRSLADKWAQAIKRSDCVIADTYLEGTQLGHVICLAVFEAKPILVLNGFFTSGIARKPYTFYQELPGVEVAEFPFNSMEALRPHLQTFIQSCIASACAG